MARQRWRVHYYKYDPRVNYLNFNFRANLIRAEEMHKLKVHDLCINKQRRQSLRAYLFYWSSLVWLSNYPLNCSDVVVTSFGHA